MTIPPYSASGLLPPYVGLNPALGVSPYPTDSLELVRRFATSQARCQLLLELFNWRGLLVGIGLEGVQWLDGSFCEDIETLERRDPRDVDVVTIFQRPAHLRTDAAWGAQIAASPAAFDHAQLKANNHLDTYWVDVQFGPALLVEQVSYWCGLWSHRRVTQEWKGMVALPLRANLDAPAIAELAMLRVRGGW